MFRWLCVPLALMGCGGDAQDDDTSNPSSLCGDLQFQASEFAGSSYVATWSSQVEGTPTITLDLNETSWTYSADESGTSHTVSLNNLRYGGDYIATVEVSGADGTEVCTDIELDVPSAPGGIMRFDINLSDPGSAMETGYLVLSTLQADSSWVAVVDGLGRFRFVQATDETNMSVGRARPSRDGTSVWWSYYDLDRVDDIGGIGRVRLDGTESSRTRTLLAHHDFVELPTGDLAWLGYDRRDFAMPANVEDPDYAANCPGGVCPVATDTILEGPEGMVEGEMPVEISNWWEDLSYDPFWVCDHMWDFGSFVPDYYEWTHGNSIAYVDSQDAFYVMARYLDSLYKVDRATGQVLWQMGGAANEFTLTDGEWWDHGHMSEVTENSFLVFDNGDHRGFSRVSKYSWDESAMTVSQDWSLDHPSGSMLPILGDVRTLPNGNYLVVWSADAFIQEVTPEGVVVWEMQSSAGAFGVIARATYVESL